MINKLHGLDTYISGYKSVNNPLIICENHGLIRMDIRFSKKNIIS